MPVSVLLMKRYANCARCLCHCYSNAVFLPLNAGGCAQQVAFSQRSPCQGHMLSGALFCLGHSKGIALTFLKLCSVLHVSSLAKRENCN